MKAKAGTSIDLKAGGIRLYAARMYNHDYLWFSSTEVSKMAATLPVIHNYALSYAISGFSYGIYAGYSPRYEEDLSRMPAYATPAVTDGTVPLTRLTQNAINSRTLRTDDAPKGSNSPALGRKLVLDPIWPNARNRGFAFYVFTRNQFKPPAVVRLGKKGCPVRFVWDEITSAIATYSEDPCRPTHALNPFDLQGEILSYDPVAIPPHLVLRFADVRKDWFILCGEHRVHLPRRFTTAGAFPVSYEVNLPRRGPVPSLDTA